MKKILLFLFMLIPCVVKADVVMPEGPLDPEYYLYHPLLLLAIPAFIAGIAIVIIFIVKVNKKNKNGNKDNKDEK